MALESHLTDQPYLMGGRPGASDFALYGQLTQLVGFDPTSRAITHKLSPRTVAYTGLMEDQTGLEPSTDDWNTAETLPDLEGHSERSRSCLCPSATGQCQSHGGWGQDLGDGN